MTGDEFKQIRIDAGLSQARLAFLFGVTEDYVSSWESGSRTVSGPASVVMEVIQRHGVEPVERAGELGPMTPHEFDKLHDGLPLSRSQVGAIVRISDLRTMKRWSSGRDNIPGPSAIALRLMVAGIWPPEGIRAWKKAYLEMLTARRTESADPS